MRLLGGNFAGGDVLDDGVWPRRAERYSEMLGDAKYIEKRVAQPIGVTALKEVRLADRQRINRT